VRRGLVHEQITPLQSDMNEFAHPFGVRYELQQTSMIGRALAPPAIRYGSQSANAVETPRYAIITCFGYAQWTHASVQQ
jgi:hypothetical protein